jgi:hypothetical protein
LFDLRNDPAEAIVVAVLGSVSPHKAGQIGKGLIEGVKKSRRKPAG